MLQVLYIIVSVLLIALGVMTTGIWVLVKMAKPVSRVRVMQNLLNGDFD